MLASSKHWQFLLFIFWRNVGFLALEFLYWQSLIYCGDLGDDSSWCVQGMGEQNKVNVWDCSWYSISDLYVDICSCGKWKLVTKQWSYLVLCSHWEWEESAQCFILSLPAVFSTLNPAEYLSCLSLKFLWALFKCALLLSFLQSIANKNFPELRAVVLRSW